MLKNPANILCLHSFLAQTTALAVVIIILWDKTIDHSKCSKIIENVLKDFVS